MEICEVLKVLGANRIGALKKYGQLEWKDVVEALKVWRKEQGVFSPSESFGQGL